MKKIIFFLLLFQIFIPVFSDSVQLINTKSSYNLAKDLLILEDKTNSLTIHDILDVDNKSDFQKCRDGAPDFSFSESTFWLTFKILNNFQGVDKVILELQHVFAFGDFFLIYKTSSGDIIEHQIGHEEIPHRYKEIYLPVKYKTEQDFYIRVKANGRPLEVPMLIWTEKSFFKKSIKEYAIITFCFGIVAFLIIISVIYGLSLKDNSFIYFGLFLLIALIHQSWFIGVSINFIMNTLKIKYEVGMQLWGCLILSLLLLLNFLVKNHIVGHLKKIMYLLSAGGLLLIIAPFFEGGPQLMDEMKTIAVLVVLFTLFFIVIEAKSIKRHLTSSIYLILGLFGLMLGYLLHILDNRAVLPYHPILEYSMQIGFMCQIVFFFIAIYMRMRIFMDEKRQAEDHVKALVDYSSIAIVIFREDDLIYVNNEFEKIFNYNNKKIDSIDLWLGSAVPDSASRDNLRYLFKHPVLNPETFEMLTSEGEIRNIEFIINRSNNTGFVIMNDITEKIKNTVHLQSLLKQKEILLSELYHRTENNIQVISSMLHLRSQSCKDEAVRNSFLDIENKIYSMALVYRKLFDSKDFSYIDLRDYIHDLVIHIKTAYSEKIDVSIECEDIKILFDTALPLGLIIYELVSNSFTHAFEKSKKGNIVITAGLNENNNIQLYIADDGIGLQEEFSSNTHFGSGLQTVKDLIEYQLDGHISFENRNGLQCQINIRNDMNKSRI